MIGKAINYGLIGAGIGAATIGGSAALGIPTAQTNGNTEVAMGIGGALGLGLGVGTVAMGKNMDKVLAGVGKAAVGTGKVAFGAGKGVVNAVTGANYSGMAKSIGSRALGIGNATLNVGTGVSSVGISAAAKTASRLGAIGSSMFKVSPGSGTVVPDIKLSGFGKAAVAGGGIVAAAKGAFDTYESLKRGANDGQITTATPTTPQYSSQMRDGGATGDLNFSMYRNR